MSHQTVHDFVARSISGEDVALSRYRGKVLLIVNTASECGYTPQYAGLQKLYQQFAGKLEILAFPCNQFGGQEAGTEAEIKQFCDSRFHVKFPIFSKVNVNGDRAHPLFVYLKDALPGILGSKRIKWNFTKFLVDVSGVPVKRFAPNDAPESLIHDIEAQIR